VPAAEADDQVARVVEGVGRSLLPQAPDEPAVRLAWVVSAPGVADADALVQESQRRMLARKAAPLPAVAPLG
jgi:hypothetical protein